MITDINTVITEWVARLDKLEEIANAAIAFGDQMGEWVWGKPYEQPNSRLYYNRDGLRQFVHLDPWAEQINAHSPASVLADIKAKREVLRLYRAAEVERVETWSTSFEAAERAAALGRVEALELAIRTLAGATEETT